MTGGVFTSPPLTEFNVTVDGQAVAVTRSGFRRRAVSVPPQVRDLRVESRLFLRLAAPVPEGAVVVVTNPGAALWPAGFSFAITASPLRLSHAIHVNQEGHTTTLPKQVMIGYNLGSLGELPLNPALGFSLVETGSGNTVFSGPLTRRADAGFTMAPQPYQEVLQADFSAWQTPGEYRLQVPGLGASLPFLIADGMAMNFTRAYFYFVKFPVAQASSLCGQRASSPLIPQLNKVELCAGHLPAALRGSRGVALLPSFPRRQPSGPSPGAGALSFLCKSLAEYCFGQRQLQSESPSHRPPSGD